VSRKRPVRALGLAKAVDRGIGALVQWLLLPWRAVRDWTASEEPIAEVREIAVVKFWGIGNAALLLPVLARLRRRYPAARITVVTLAGNEPVYEGAADRILAVRVRPLLRGLFDLLGLVWRLRRDRIDIALDMEQFLRTSQVLLFLARVRQVVAFDTPGLSRATLADVRVPYDDERHMAEGFLDLARSVGVTGGRYEPGGLRAQKTSPVPRGAYPMVVLHPGSGDNFPGRRWPARNYGDLARRLHDAGARVVVTGGASERDIVDEVIRVSERPLLDCCGTLSLDELVALLAEAELLVSNDTGPVHLASALNKPVLALYGPNTPRLYGPLSAGSRAFYDAPPCSPCITNFNHKTSRCLNPVCIQAIGTDIVAAAALARIKASRSGSSERTA
jgi:ADP-heptose:LPS heptosyltransferase